MGKHITAGILLGLMILSAGAAFALKPTQLVANLSAPVDLNLLVPRKIGDWVEEIDVPVLVADPQQAAMLNKIYSQTLSRSYKHPNGNRIMLSIAYGSDQRDAMQVHKPEVCYPAQGFVLKETNRGVLQAGNRVIPVVRVDAVQGIRNEPITYWTTVGDQVVHNGVNKKLLEIRFGLTGKIPDGMLIRISSIDDDSTRAYLVHQQFADDFLRSSTPEGQKRLFGLTTQGNKK